MKNNYSIKPKVRDRWIAISKNSDFLESTRREHTGPIYLYSVKEFRNNIDVLSSASPAKIRYASKVNNQVRFVKEAVKSKIGIYCSSLDVLNIAIDAKSTDISYGGPLTKEILNIANKTPITLILNRASQLEQVVNYNWEKDQKIMVRLTGFKVDDSQIVDYNSKLGIKHTEVAKILKLLQTNKRLKLCGFAYHGEDDQTKERQAALTGLIEATLIAFDFGYSPTLVNIGGGLRQNTVEDNEEINTYQKALRNHLANYGKEMTWNGGGIGYQVLNSKVVGFPSFYPYVSHSEPKEELISYINTTVNIDGSTASFLEMAGDLMLNIELELGKSLVDNCAATLVNVLSVDKIENETYLVQVDIKHEDLLMQKRDWLTDPIIIKDERQKKQTFNYYLADSLDSNSSFISRRKFYGDEAINQGDRLLFINTAAYGMGYPTSSPNFAQLPNSVFVDHDLQ